MGFFKKLKERLFKSSSKIDEGLDAIIEDGGEAEEVELEEDLKTEKETDDYAKSEQADIESVLNEPQLEQVQFRHDHSRHNQQSLFAF